MKKYFYLLAMLAVVLGATACSDDDNHPSTNILDKPEVTVPDVKESSAVITWKAIGNATAYIYSLNNGSEQSTDQNTIQLTGLEPEKSYTFKVKAQKTGSIYFEDSDYAEITFTTTSEVTVYRIATFADDWDKWYYEYNDNGTVKRVYRLYEGELDREWLFAYDGNNITRFSDGIEQFKVQTYSAVPNVSGAHCIYAESSGASRWLVETGLFGKASANCHTSSGWQHSSSTATYTFEYDENSCIKEESKNYDGYIENFYYTYFSE